jgi:hypothetical protein
MAKNAIRNFIVLPARTHGQANAQHHSHCDLKHCLQIDVGSGPPSDEICG